MRFTAPGIISAPATASCVALTATSVSSQLEDWGLSAREAEQVQRRHQRLHGSALGEAEVASALHAVDALHLMPSERAHHLVKVSDSLAALHERCAAPRPRPWCTYKKNLCDCGVLPQQQQQQQQQRHHNHHAAAADTSARPLPRAIALDFEFRPLRCAAVDASLSCALDVLVPDRHAFPMLPGVLACDRRTLTFSTAAEVRSWVLGHLAAGVPVVGHTVASDLSALHIGEADLPAGARVVDVARRDASGQTLSLRSMARARLGMELHAPGERHCALQDAEAAMRLYELQEQEDEEGESPWSLFRPQERPQPKKKAKKKKKPKAAKGSPSRSGWPT